MNTKSTRLNFGKLWKDNIMSFILCISFSKKNKSIFIFKFIKRYTKLSRKRISGWQSASYRYEVIGEREATITYRSKRNMTDYFFGLLQGSTEYFGEKISIEELSRKDGVLVLKIRISYPLIKEKKYKLNKLFPFSLLK